MNKITLRQCGIVVLLLIGGAGLHSLIGGNSPKVDTVQTVETPYSVTPPAIPDQLVFDNETIDLKRYDRHERIDRELMSYMYMHATTSLIIKRANRIYPIVEPMLKRNGIPDDFKYMMTIESSLNITAKSPAGAAGLWQLMPQTAKQLGLEVSDDVDERYDIEKSTRAACKYIRQAYAKYGDWMLVSASYNAGQARISSLLEKQKVKHAMDLWLVDETSRYMFRMLAIKELMKSPRRYGFLLKSEQLYPQLRYNVVKVDTTITSLSDYAARMGITYAQLREANPWLRGYSLPNKSRKVYEIKIPTQESMYYNPKRTKPHNRNWVID
jgi:hypothetical protein